MHRHYRGMKMRNVVINDAKKKHPHLQIRSSCEKGTFVGGLPSFTDCICGGRLEIRVL